MKYAVARMLPSRAKTDPETSLVLSICEEEEIPFEIRRMLRDGTISVEDLRLGLIFSLELDDFEDRSSGPVTFH